MGLTELIHIKYVVAALLYSTIGVAIFALSFTLLDLLTPKVSIWKELVEKQNVAVAIFLGAIAFGIATIIASAIHG